MDLQNRLVYIPTVQLEHHPKNPRVGYNDIDELAESIKVKGVMQNLTVVKNGENKYYVVIGNRRLEAARLAGLAELPCAIAEMTEQEIVSTMLVENMQRSDLNAYEQAQGIQMMLDLGETVGSIAEKTGFSETTVRRRVKLAELDREKLKEIVEDRQISLGEIDKLSEIKDIKKRNKLLDIIGTNSFEYEVKRTVQAEKDDESNKMWRELAEQFGLTELKDKDRWSGEYDNISNAHNRKEFEAAVKKKAKFFFPLGNYCNLYKKASSKKPRKSKEEIEREERVARLNLECERMYNSRAEFVKNISEGELKGGIDYIAGVIVHEGIDNTRFWWTLARELLKLFGLEQEPNGKDAAHKATAIANSKPMVALFRFAYCLLDDNKDAKCHDYSGKYNKNERLERIYDLLETFGYRTSDAEESILSGSSEMYYRVDPIAKEVKDEIGRLAMFDLNEKLVDKIYKLLQEENKEELVELVTSCARDKVCYFCGADVKCDRQSASAKCWKADEEQIEEDVDSFFEAYHRIKERGEWQKT